MQANVGTRFEIAKLEVVNLLQAVLSAEERLVFLQGSRFLL
jgi:hypothetical protein